MPYIFAISTANPSYSAEQKALASTVCESLDLSSEKSEKIQNIYANSKLSLYSLLNNIIKKGHKIYGIGAPSRASTLVNFLGLDRNIINCVCEIEGSYKIGNYMPGTNIPIVSEKNLYKKKPKFVILFS